VIERRSPGIVVGAARRLAWGLFGLLARTALRRFGVVPLALAALFVLRAAPTVGPRPAAGFAAVALLAWAVHRRRARRRRHPAGGRPQVVVVERHPPTPVTPAGWGTPGRPAHRRGHRNTPAPATPPGPPVAPVRIADMTAEQLHAYLRAYRAYAAAWTARDDRP